MLNEICQNLQCLDAGDRPAKLRQAARVIGKSRVHHIHHLACDGIGLKTGGRGQFAGPGFAKTAAVVGIKIPLTADRLIALHQDAMFASEFAVEIFEPQAFASVSMCLEFANCAEEMVVIPNLQCHGMLFCSGAQLTQHTPITRRRHHQLAGLVLTNGSVKLACQAAGVAQIINVAVDDRPMFVAQALRKMPHGTQEQRGSLFGRGHMGGLLIDLGHPNGVLGGVKARQCRRLVVQLVTQHQHQISSHKVHGCVMWQVCLLF